MKVRFWFASLIAVLLMGSLAPAFAQDGDEGGEGEGDKEDKELKWGGTPYPFTGPDTGFGVGFSILYRDMFGKEGRDTTFTASYTTNQYQDLSIEWQEPRFLAEDGRFKIKLAWSTRPGLRFNGFGNDTRHHGDASNYSWLSYELSPTYIYRFPETQYGVIGLRAGLQVKYADPENGKLDEKDEGSYYIPIREAYPEVYRSEDFDPAWLIGPTITFYHDAREDRFPLGGGREEVVWPVRGFYEEVTYKRIDESIGANFSYNHLTVDLRTYFPIFSEDTILAARFKTIITQGDIPFYEMPSYGGGSDLRGYFGSRWTDKNGAQAQLELRQGMFPDTILPLFGGAIKLQYPSIAVFYEEARVFEDYAKMPEEFFEDWHYSYGLGFRFIITPSVVIRLEYAWSEEQTNYYMSAGLPI